MKPRLQCLALVFLTNLTNFSIATELLKLTADDADPQDLFGGATPAFVDRTVDGIAIQENRALVGAPGADTEFGNEAGAAFLFDTTTGQQLLRLAPDEAASNQTFGSAVGLSGNTAIVGAANNVEGASIPGAAYLFDASTGQQLLTLLPEATVEKFTGFGWSANIDGDKAIVGAPFHPPSPERMGGSAFLFDVTTGTQLFHLAADREPLDDNWYGSAVDIGGDRAIVGAWADNEKGELAGAAFVYDVKTGQQLYKLTPRDAQPFDQFGQSVAIHENLALVGAPVADDDTGEFSGAAYLFDLTTGQQLHKLRAIDGETNDNFGWSVDIQGTTAIIGAKGDRDAGFFAGAAYIFDVTTGQQVRQLSPHDIAAGDRFGWAVALDGNHALVASPFNDDACPSGQCDSGSAYVFDISSSTALRAGDANQDLSFDQRDIVLVSQAGKYLSGQNATWGQGDWDGAPGGSVGNSPAGDGFFNQRDIVAALTAGIYLTGPYTASSGSDGNALTRTSIGYDEKTGQMWLVSDFGPLTSLNIDSVAGIFNGTPATNLSGAFDNHANHNLFKATFGGSFGSLSFGPIAQPGLTEQFLLNDLSIIGSLAGGGSLQNVGLIFVAVPEPSGILLVVSSILAAAGFLRARRSFRQNATASCGK